MLDKIEGQPDCLWVACPDVVADAAATLDLFQQWQPRLKGRNLPVALVAQDGLEKLRVPWSKLEALFIGGSTEWKEGDAARKLARRCKARGKLLHMGRVNSLRRIRLAAEFGCDSIDGSGFSMFPDTRIPKGLRWIEQSLREAVVVS
jgi:hypothetical protein